MNNQIEMRQLPRMAERGEIFHQPCCFGGDPDEACGYPPKTVRAIISIIIVFLSFTTFVFLAIYLALKEQYTEAMGIAGIISSVLSGVIGYYFGSKQAKPPHDLNIQQQFNQQPDPQPNPQPESEPQESEPQPQQPEQNSDAPELPDDDAIADDYS